MFIILGLRTSSVVRGIVTVACAHCHNPAAHRIEQVSRVFTVFFLPLFTARRQVTMTCTYCGIRSELPADQAERLVAFARDPQAARANPGATDRPGTADRSDGT